MIRFDTRDKKPKLYNVAVLSGIVLAVVVILFLIRPAVPVYVIGIIIAAYVAVVIVLLMRAFFGQLRYNPYSYNTIYYVGFSLYLFSVFIVVTLTAIVLITRQTEPYESGVNEGEWILSTLYNSPRKFMLYSSPFILVFSV